MWLSDVCLLANYKLTSQLASDVEIQLEERQLPLVNINAQASKTEQSNARHQLLATISKASTDRLKVKHAQTKKIDEVYTTQGTLSDIKLKNAIIINVVPYAPRDSRRLTLARGFTCKQGRPGVLQKAICKFVSKSFHP